MLHLTPEYWDKHGHLRAGLGFALMVCTLAAGVQWYSWAEHQGVAVYVPILWSFGALLIFVLGPKKLDLLASCATIYFVLGSIGTLLGRAHGLSMVLEVTVLPATVAFSLFYVEARRKQR